MSIPGQSVWDYDYNMFILICLIKKLIWAWSQHDSMLAQYYISLVIKKIVLLTFVNNLYMIRIESSYLLHLNSTK